MAVLNNGNVLISGGLKPGATTGAGIFLSSAEIYDLNTGKFSLLSNSLDVPRYGNSATLLSNGKVLLAGGASGDNFTGFAVINSGGTVYDPTTEIFSATLNKMPSNSQRGGVTPVALQSGIVLLAGGAGGSVFVNSTSDLYNPNTNLFSSGPNLITGRYLHSSILLRNGKVLLAGGIDTSNNSLGSAELYDPSSNLFSTTGTRPTARYSHSAILQSNGNAIIIGGTEKAIVSYSSGQFTSIGTLYEISHKNKTTLLFDNGIIFISCNSFLDSNDFGDYNDSTLFNLVSGTWTVDGAMRDISCDRGLLLKSGKALLVDGTKGKAYLYSPPTTF